MHVNACLDGINFCSDEEIRIIDKPQKNSIKSESFKTIIEDSVPSDDNYNIFSDVIGAPEVNTQLTESYPKNPRKCLIQPLYIDLSSKESGGKRKVPFYKFLHDTNLTIDAFSFGRIPGCDGYFLTHFHADHYGGLTGKFDFGPIYCSQITCNLIKLQIKVRDIYLVPLAMNTPILINGVTVTLIDANQ